MEDSVEKVVTMLGDYCERAGQPGLFAEPLNAATNLLFMLAAVVAGRALLTPPPIGGRLGGGPPQSTLSPQNTPDESAPLLTSPRWGEGRNIDLWLLVAALFSIGIGSGIWHMFPTEQTVLMDVIPITLFIHIYLIATLRRVFLFSVQRTVFWWLVYCAVSVLAQIFLSPHLMHGSILYIPTYFTLMVLALTVYRRNPAVGKTFAQMLGVWTVSLICRTIDLDICSQFHWGTHFLWHTLNAWMLYRLLMVHARPRTIVN